MNALVSEMAKCVWPETVVFFAPAHDECMWLAGHSRLILLAPVRL
jgi:hypothetical protein